LTKEKMEEATETAKQLSAKAHAVATEAIKSKDVAVLQDAHKTFAEVDLPKVPDRTKPLRLPLVPKRLTELFNSFNPGVAGPILLSSSLLRGVRIGLFTIPGAAIAWLGPTFYPGLGAGVYLGVGLLLGVLGAIFGRARY